MKKKLYFISSAFERVRYYRERPIKDKMGVRSDGAMRYEISFIEYHFIFLLTL